LKFLFLEPFFGGSHKDFAEGLCSYSRHEIDLMTLPARFWKWRMRGAALYFADKITSLKGSQGLITTDLMSLSDFKALRGKECPPSLAYFHENQLTYPLAPDESMDFQFGFTDITTALAAERVMFNSRTHFDAFFSSLPDFLRMMPEYRLEWVVNEILSKAGVLYPGCQFSAEREEGLFSSDSPPLVIWNHRWEFDKNPADFFDALDAVLAQGLDFRLALLGENFQKVPNEFIAARERLKHRIVQYGYVKSKEEYREWLKLGSIVISTATQENFGISVIEAVRHGCMPLLPERLSYPEIIPTAFHPDVLYKDRSQLIEKLCYLITNYEQFREKIEALSNAMIPFAWNNMIDMYDDTLEKLAVLAP
jgi:glycosyltransferase involved in cell wall biosynthesis